MRRLMRTILAVWFAITMTLAQGCVDVSSSGNPYSSNGRLAPNSSGSGSSSGGLSSGSGGTVKPVATTHLDTTGYTASQRESQALTDYLKQHRLPLVGAQVLHGRNAQQAVVLYGYVGSEFGKSDATAKASKYLNDPAAAIDNRIQVQPEILAGAGSGSARDAASASSGGEAEPSNPDNAAYPGADSYVAQQNEAAQYAQQQQGQQTGVSIGGGFVPLAIFGLMALSMASGGAFSVGSGSSGFSGGAFSPPPPYKPYPGYGSPPPYPSYGP
jgi:hypothetical protein